MSTTAAVLLVALAALAVSAAAVVRTWLSWREKRLITCPENDKPAAVRVDALRAAAGALTGQGDLRLSECSRWPEKQGCGQECLGQIAKGPGDCLVRTLVARWYEGKACASCGKPIRDVAWADQRPGLCGPDGRLVAWPDVAPETLPDVFKTHAAICWDCLVVGKVAREHPDDVTVRPPREQLYS
ncbi:MAG TPA: hypothetical protein VMV60_07525 [Thermoanaerobaculia bacterium]|nr:hypothetical protein [Thermoanaerobaculia bacterium]